ncbi:Uncharacterized conserved protein, DUF1800 family [Polaromonas sp. OV174]|uniref:DUF1800 domain-containing protein n=1 Tax=Polaromonas sp. OV174 TaxID=1855300 RepID=UPI0008E34773|nr:DUF1800 domain-containing protein [Polaromonas sp. OV174]SFB95426.1 Uncharacterized conserved protein, DUF1800 family [Polaromonas sp. OV174]
MTPLKIIASCAWLLASVCSQAAVPEQFSADQARYFLTRTGFSPDQAEVDALTGRPSRQAISELIRQAKAAKPVYPAPTFVAQPPPVPYRSLKSKEEQQAWRQQQLLEGLELKTWWMREMIASPTPLQERMTLFWHNHFATSQQKVYNAQAMWRQQLLLRADALGDFRSLLHAVAKSPAMLVYLDGANSRKESPNENFAREVMELFTLGEATQGGHYTEQDIREAARAFTGWSVDREDFSFKFRPVFHDGGNKTVLGHSGNLDGDAVLDILLEQPEAARFIVGKLWKEFVSPQPDNAQIERIAQRFRASGYDIGVALNELLLSDAFWADSNRGSLIKSPVDLVVGTVRQFDFSYSDAMPFVLKAAQLGQNLLVPPNVKGWPGQNDWINATTLLERKRFTEQLFRAVEFKGQSAMAPGGRTADEAVTSMATMRPLRQMQAEFAGGQSGAGSNQQALRLLGREGVIRVAQGLATISFDPERWLAQYGGAADREPSDELKARLAQTLLALPATQTIASGTVGVAYLRNLTLDPAYQLK